MLLMGVKEENGWLCSQWKLTYGTGWTEITKAVKTAYPYYENVEVLVDNKYGYPGNLHGHQSTDDGQVL